FSITGGSDLTLHEIQKAAQIVKASADPSANISFGVVSDEKMQGEVKITVIATGFGSKIAQSKEADEGVKSFFTRDHESQQARPEFGTDEEDINIPACLRHRSSPASSFSSDRGLPEWRDGPGPRLPGCDARMGCGELGPQRHRSPAQRS